MQITIEEKNNLLISKVLNMPYKIRGNAVVKKDTGKVVGHSKNPKKYLRTLQAVEHGWKPTKRKKKKK